MRGVSFKLLVDLCPGESSSLSIPFYSCARKDASKCQAKFTGREKCNNTGGSVEVLDTPEFEEKNKWARALRYSWLAVSAVFLLVVGIMVMRWSDNRQYERQMERKEAEKRAEQDRKTVEALGGNRFEILSFYASPPQVHAGDRVELCYGVSNAKTVKIEPGEEDLRPSFSRCVNEFPRKSTTYTLTATDSAGHAITATAAVRVR